ncbi:leucine-rich repeat-containing G-protein coupled receptor 5-like [Lampris incognitus]|uniref:leucine-rich repeat-containing G-protein coupled receptor 5-like n=1 Tax=Lampris incognitus TaxID=2546036 RepID=UPI0024B5874D|nr:leucine-rich repeat-containing G-protein coupled receptor 5-like [Lampris incognitus]
MDPLACAFTLLAAVMHAAGSVARADPPDSRCPAACRCEADGGLWRADCADGGLTAVPSDLSAFASSIDLSMNNLTLPPGPAFSNGHFLQELQLAGNALTDVPAETFAGLVNLKVLMLQNNHLSQAPSAALQELKSLQSLHLDANFITYLPAASFKGLPSLRHLWLDDNALTEVPVLALASLPKLQALTLALNKITHIPDRAFESLRHLVVLHLHDNQIHALGKRCFDGLHSLETLDLSFNRLGTFPTAIRDLPSLRELSLVSNNIGAIPDQVFTGNPYLETINIQNNPVQFIGESAFQQLTQLQTLSLSGAADISALPDLTGTNQLESLTITGTCITSIPSTFCENLPNLQHLDLSHNQIQSLPSFSSCQKIRKIDLGHNAIHEVWSSTFPEMRELRSLDLTSNHLSSLSLEALQGLTHLRLAGNPHLNVSLPLHLLPRLRVVEMPFQCCVFQKSIKSRGPEDLGVTPGAEAGPQPAVWCSPAPGTCDESNEPKPEDWQFCLWVIFILSVIFNFLVLVSISLWSTCNASAQHFLAVLFWLHFLTGLSGATLTVADMTSAHHVSTDTPWREKGAALRIVDFVLRVSSETSVFLMMAFVFEGRNCDSDLNWPKSGRRLLRRRGIQVSIAVSCALALAVAFLPLVVIGEVCVSSSCPTLAHQHQACRGYGTALVLVNSLCYLLMTVARASLCCYQGKAKLNPGGVKGRTATRTVTLLLVTNGLLSACEAVLRVSSHFHITSPAVWEAADPTALLAAALPACLDPLLYMFTCPRFRQELFKHLPRT